MTILLSEIFKYNTKPIKAIANNENKTVINVTNPSKKLLKELIDVETIVKAAVLLKDNKKTIITKRKISETKITETKISETMPGS